MKATLFIVSYARDFPYLHGCLRSIQKFATGFHTTLLIPTRDLALFTAQFPGWVSGPDFTLFPFQEWEGLGMLHHEYHIMNADGFSDADYFVHLDSDCIFTEPVTPDFYFVAGKPILRYEAFDSLGKRCPGVLNWQKATEACLPFPIIYETMRGHPEVYHRSTYEKARNLMELKTGETVEAYIRRQHNAFPQTFCEFVTLGNVALRCQPQLYHPHDQASQANPDFCDNRLQQFWSHRSLDQPQDIWVKGQQLKVVPAEFMRQVLGKW